MDPNAIVSLVGSLGFPIVCCGALFFQQNKFMREMSDKIESAVEKSAARTEAATNKMSENLEKNTLAINTLVTTVTVIARKDDQSG